MEVMQAKRRRRDKLRSLMLYSSADPGFARSVSAVRVLPFLVLRVGFPLRLVFAILRSSPSLIDLTFGAKRL